MVLEMKSSFEYEIWLNDWYWVRIEILGGVGGCGGGLGYDKLYGYVLLWRVWFLSSLVWDRG